MRFEITDSDRAALAGRAPEFAPVIAAAPDVVSFECFPSVFDALVQSVISQQLALRAADAVAGRVRELLGGRITAAALLDSSPDELRGCGLSARKAEYLRGIAGAETAGRVDFGRLNALDDAALVSELCLLRGVGQWTAEMLLIFAFARPDVLSYGDLGLRNAVMKLHGWKTLSPLRFGRFRRRVSPYGTLAPLYLWRLKDGGAAGSWGN